MQFVIVPGIDNSDEQHWQSIWEAEWGPAARRIAVASWTSPDLDDWVGAIERAVRLARTPMWCWLLTAGDVGLLQAGWATETPRRAECSWWRRLTSTATPSALLHPASLPLCLSRSSYLE
jgi:predicted alpha/beta hydrolase family esterase